MGPKRAVCDGVRRGQVVHGSFVKVPYAVADAAEQSPAT